nr:immunoglobulin light chain junction region [Macaca mulatta]MOX85187.1 immunoglobulin light chain junction region [Macaca mulatta]MOX85281.1 immunoglobulin light chain junction region [Macaca mulatta]MOX85372.1 immunoglobulin light chain junction region [Macaca mulatta]MOX85541.1 immunoglobulin light chain junction region [Macaca mulatta]
CQQVFSNPLTF